MQIRKFLIKKWSHSFKGLCKLILCGKKKPWPVFKLLFNFQELQRTLPRIVYVLSIHLKEQKSYCFYIVYSLVGFPLENWLPLSCFPTKMSNSGFPLYRNNLSIKENMTT